MRKPTLSFDVILTALAALAPLGAGCSKSERAMPEAPAANSPAQAAPPSSAATETPPPNAGAARGVDDAPPSAPVPVAEPKPVPAATKAAVDAGTEHSRSKPKSNAPAACGAMGCSPDMKKGTK